MFYQNDISNRQVEVLKLTSQGYTRKQIAELLHYDEGTIKRDRVAVVRKLGARNICHAITLGFAYGVLGE